MSAPVNTRVPAGTPPSVTLSSEKKRPFLGRAVQNGQIIYSSVSQIVIFDPSMEGGCNRRWAYIYVFSRKEEKTAAQLAGNRFAESLEAYLKTGYDTFAPELRAAKHYLPAYDPARPIEAERDLAKDIERAIELRKQYLSLDLASRERPEIVRLMREAAGLLAEGVPLIGAFDYRHRRQEYVDEYASLRREDPRHVVGETGDLKSTSRINDHTSRNGKVYPGYAKTAEQIAWHPQMLGYALNDADEHPEHTHERVSHIYAQTKNGLAGAKRTVLLTVDEVRERWRVRVEPQMRGMLDVAKATAPERVDPNYGSCVSYNKPCPHADYCDRSGRTIYHVLKITEESDMPGNGLFDLIAQAAAPTTGQNATIPDDSGLATATAPADIPSIPAVPSVPAIPPIPDTGGLAAIIPPDAPEPGPLDAAAPLSPEAIAEIQDPAFRLKVEEHARLHAEARAKEAAEKAAKGEKTSGNCPGGKQWVTLDPSKVKKRGNKFTCSSCGKELPVKPSEDGTKAELPGHRIPQKEDKGLPTSLVDGGSGAVRLPADLQAHADALDAAATNRVRAALAALPAIPGDEALPEIPGADLPAIPAGLVTVGAGVVPGKSPLDGRPIVESAADERARIVAVVEEVLAPFRDEVRGSLEKIFAAVHAR